MKGIGEALQASTLRDKYKLSLGRRAVSQDMRDFAGAFVERQAQRHLADYDPAASFEPSERALITRGAEMAMEAFYRVAADEKADVLAFLLVGARG
jgi:methanogenic corrinoid protein MtbC1